MRTGRWIAAIWLCFLARLAFYSAMLPLWEGYDEWSHFAVIRSVAWRGGLLPARQDPIPRDVELSMDMAPVPWEMRASPAPALTEDAYWLLPPEARSLRESAFRAIPPQTSRQDGVGPMMSYEAMQAPLYYWIMAPVLRLLSRASLAQQVILVRWLGSLAVSLVVPLVFRIGRMVLDDDRLALGCAAIAALMPELALDAARAANDGLAVLWFTLLIWLGLILLRSGVSYSLAAWIGLVLGLGLLTKAYFLTALPAVAFLYGYEFCRRKQRRMILFAALLTGCIASLIAAWWYWNNIRVTGGLSGVSEAVALRGVGAFTIIQRSLSANWLKAIDSVVFSHIYFGDWSFLTVRSWMYHVFYAVILLAAAGLIRRLGQPGILWLAIVYAAFWVGQAYHIALAYVAWGIAASGAWYLYAVIGAEVVLCVAGLDAVLPVKARRWSAAGGATLFALLDLYTMHAVAIPYYTGMIRHKPNGALAALHWVDYQAVGWHGALARLAGFKETIVPGPVPVVLWTAYLLATIGLVAAAWTFRPSSAAPVVGAR
jgi:4-amino-4-deoxy-L-arabinose transferase-like glycosyltransferase